MTTIASLVGDGKTIALGATGAVVEMIQRALLAAGHELVSDGDFGTITQTAVKQFQVAHGLASVGYVGPKTAAALDGVLAKGDPPPTPLPSALKVAPHLATMRAITGTKEVPGSANSPVIMSWRDVIAKAFPEMRDYAMGYTGDAIPWCGFGMAYCLAQNGLRPVFGKSDTQRFMWAGAWSQDCAELKLLKPPYPVGSILTFTRSGGGHVALLEGEDGDTFIIRGCNQSDMVNVVTKGKAQFTAATWPRALPIPAYARPPRTLAGAISAGKEA